MKLGPPNQYNLKFLRTWLTDTSKGNLPISGIDGDNWDNFERDLIAVRRETSQGRLPHALKYKIIPFLYGRIGSDSSGEKEINDTMLAMIIEVVGSLIASLMPLTAILALYFIKNQLTRLFAIIGFTAAFYLAILLMTDGTRQVEVFTATSA
jgi:hypothetical protein